MTGQLISNRPEWRNWYTHQTQNLARFTPHVGSSPTSGTSLQPHRKREISLNSTGAPLSATKPPLGPPLKWAGGKRWLLRHLAPLWQPNASRRYVEPFCGGLAAALGLRPERALLNDVNPHLINFYRQLQSGLQITIETRNDEEL